MSWIDISFSHHDGAGFDRLGACGTCGHPVSLSQWNCCSHIAVRMYVPPSATHEAVIIAYAESVEIRDDGSWILHPVTGGVPSYMTPLEAWSAYRIAVDGDEHKCFECVRVRTDMHTVRLPSADIDEYRVCFACLETSGYAAECRECGDIFDASHVQSINLYDSGDYETYCTPCYLSQNFEQCEHCSRYRREGDEICCTVNRWGFVDNCACWGCNRERRNQPNAIHAYSYRPTLRFLSVGGDIRHGVDGRGLIVDRTPYLGFELEVEVNRSLDLRATAVEFAEAIGEDFYLKSDGSISHGFEIVSHPMTLEYAMRRVNWGAIRSFRKDWKIRSEDNCGMHVHVSRKAFTSPAHEFRWMMLFHRNRLAMQALAGRESSYARFDNTNRTIIGKVVKGEVSHRESERYSAINLWNEHTYEVRIFESSVFVNRVQAYLQLVEATVEYTRYLVSSKILKDGGFSFGEFVVWLNTNRARYAQLIQRIKATVPDGGYGERLTESQWGYVERYIDEYGDRNTRRVYRNVVVQES